MGVSSRPSGSAIQTTMPLASRTPAARVRRSGSDRVSETRAKSPQIDAMVFRSTSGFGGTILPTSGLGDGNFGFSAGVGFGSEASDGAHGAGVAITKSSHEDKSR